MRYSSLVRSLAQPPVSPLHLHLQHTRPTDIFRDLHHEETRNAVHLEGGLTVEVRRPMKMQIVYSSLRTVALPCPVTTRALGHYFMVIG